MPRSYPPEFRRRKILDLLKPGRTVQQVGARRRIADLETELAVTWRASERPREAVSPKRRSRPPR
jgi:hypothetical protein